MEIVIIKDKKIVRCPNPDCDVENGCCVCEHTGWIYEYVLDEMEKTISHDSASNTMRNL